VKVHAARSTHQNAALRTALLFDPGERWCYGTSLDWVGRIVEVASGKRLGAYLQENLFAPLGMASTGFGVTPSMRERLATIHQRGDDDALGPLMGRKVPEQPEADNGGGGLWLYGTAGDYLRFIRLILNRGTADGTRLLKPEPVDPPRERSACHGGECADVQEPPPCISRNFGCFSLAAFLVR
jgi:methyl acetate hydrolase